MIHLYTEKFEWGVNDCCLAAANYYMRHTGVDYASEFRGKYTTAMGAYRLLSKAGGMEAILERNGFKKLQNPLYARTGDVALIYQKKRGLSMGIIDRSKGVFAGGMTFPLSQLQAVYRKL